SASPICLMARASSTKSWLWHQRLSLLNFDTINDLTKNDLVSGLPKFKYRREHLCPSCEQGKSKRASHPPKLVIQICLWCVDSGCSKRMTENLKLLINFVWKFMGTIRFRNDHVAAILGFGIVRFGNDHIAVILGFGDLYWGNILITRVYFVEGLGHNLFSVGQFCDSDLKNSTDDEGDDNEEKDDDGDEEDEGDDGEEGDGDDDDEDNDGKEGDDDDDVDQEVERDDDEDDEEEDEGNGEEDLGLNIGGEERHVEEEEEDELYKDVNINQGRGIQATLEVEDSYVTLTPVNPDGQQQSSSVSSQFVTSMLNLILDVGMESIFEATSQLDVQTPTSVAPLPLSAPTMTPSTITTITTTSEAPILPTTAPSTIIQDLPNFSSLFGFDNKLRTLEAKFSEFTQTNQFTGASDRLRDEAQRENDEFLKSIDENMKKIIKEQVKEQVKSIQHSDEQRNLYKAFVEAYESDKIILDTYEETVTLKRRRDDDADKDEEPSARPDWGSKRRKEGKEPESAKTTNSGSCWNKILPAVYGSIQPWISKLAKQTDSRSSFNELMNTPLDFSNFVINRLKAMTSMPSGESPIGGVNVSSTMVLLLTGSLLVMCIPREESSLSPNSRL
nr:integrase, catalytic region, zinc finger, CCHC-type, peptidase aspartic, catalytic [Tanacetum cinerariifolium]